MGKSLNGRRVAVVGGLRTPFVKAGTYFKDLSPLAMSTHVVAEMLSRYGVVADSLDDIVWGRVIHDPRISNIAREIVLDLRLPARIRGYMVSNNCITSAHAIANLADAIAGGRSEAGIAGGVESMSQAPILFSREASRIFLEAGLASSTSQQIKALLRLRPRHFRPESLSVKEPSTGLSMGEHCEIMAKQWQISRQVQDEIALRSHLRAAQATADGRLAAEIAPLKGIDRDMIVRGDTSLERLGSLRPVFDRSSRGTLTAGNSSPLTDGAAGVLLMSEERAAKEGRKPLAFIRDVHFASLHPDDGLLMAPALAVPALLRRTGLSLRDMDIVEMHEAFGAQVACNLAAWEQGWKDEAIGVVDQAILNPLGSSIAVGHPFAATGARIVTTLAGEMARKKSRYGLVSICAAGAMAAAMILERD
ncbi:acetyl-CoA C-acyltransferase [Desulfuromonas sp. KJ2020]|uniref:acetyl-CoA C-acyltransferase n=1 Tax=Desulfuromonas sp. KJ2020 TaxID=2919173 RepID=UPI0020A7F17C|nr:acetyl-CoA C-acyltransferase [Desulfuromonas sp. KJ2020]MCP3177987.1 acetyl-CoA C-acyltransferase [Desulfuromonas sp. KJ2020]